MSKLLKVGKKVFTIGVVLTTIVWSVGIFSLPMTMAQTGGSLIKIKCTTTNQNVCKAVYYLGTDGNRYVFPTEKTYKTWYSGFTGITEISQTQMEAYPIPIGKNVLVTYRPGVKMVKADTIPKVYAVAANGTLRWVETEAVAKALYGDTWNKMIDDVPDSILGSYTLGTSIKAASDFDKAVTTAAATSINVDKGLGSAPVTGGSTLTIALAADTPASGIVIGSASRVPFTTVTLTASADGDITVDQLTVERGGVAQDGSIADVDLLDASTMLPLNTYPKTLSSVHQAVFGDDFTIAAGTTKKVIIAANMTAGALSSYAGEIPTFGVVAVALKSGTLVGTLPVTGNYQTVNGTVTAGTAAVAVGADSPAASTKEVGTKDYVVSSIKITNSSTATNQDFKVRSITFTQNGSASTDDVENIRLINITTGEIVGTVAHPTTKKVSFTGLDLLIKKGNNVTFDLKLDIKSGSARTISYDVDQKSDIVVYDTLRAANVVPSYTNSSGSAVTSSPYYNPSDTTIGNGKLQIESVAFTPTLVSENTDGVLLGKFKFVMKGEQGNITALGIKVATTTSGTLTATDIVSDLTNITIKDANGNTVGGPIDPSANAANDGFTATTTDTISVPVGETVYSVYGDLSSDWTANDTIRLGIHPEAITIKGDTSGNTITPSPAAGPIQSSLVTVKAASLTVTMDTIPAAQTVVKNTKDLEVARLVMNASDSGSALRVTQVNVRVTSTGAVIAPDVLQNIKLFVDNVSVPIGSSSQTCSGATCSTYSGAAASSATTTLTVNLGDLTIPAGATKVLSIHGDVSGSYTTGAFQVHLGNQTLTMIDSNGSTVTSSQTDGNSGAMTLTSGGTLQSSLATDPVAALVVHGTTVTVGKFTLQPKYEGVTAKSFGFSIAGSSESDIDGNYEDLAQLELWEQGGSAPLGTLPSVTGARATITPSTAITLAMNAEKTYLVKAKFATLNGANSAAASGEGVAITLSWIDAEGSSGSGATTLGGTLSLTGVGTAFKSFTIYKSVPTIALGTVSANSLTSGNTEYDLFKFNVKADSLGPIALFKFSFAVDTTTVIMSTTGYSLYESDSASVRGTRLTDTGDAKVIVTGTTGDQRTNLVETRFDVNNDVAAVNTADDGDPYLIEAGAIKYFTLMGTVSSGAGTAQTGESITTKLAGDAAFQGTSAVNAGGVDGTDQDDFIWSDLNFNLYSTSRSTVTIGWFNGYRVSGLDSTTSSGETISDND